MERKDSFVFLDIIVSPKSSRSIISIKENQIKIYLNSPPVDGKANKECIALMAKELKIPKSNILIEKGNNSKNKRLKISGLTLVEINKKLGII